MGDSPWVSSVGMGQSEADAQWRLATAARSTANLVIRVIELNEWVNE